MGSATVEPATATYKAYASHTSGLPIPSVPIAKPAAAQMNNTLGLTTLSAIAVTSARAGPMVVRPFSHFGECVERLRTSHLEMPNTMSAAPRTMRSHEAQL